VADLLLSDVWSPDEETARRAGIALARAGSVQIPTDAAQRIIASHPNQQVRLSTFIRFAEGSPSQYLAILPTALADADLRGSAIYRALSIFECRVWVPDMDGRRTAAAAAWVADMVPMWSDRLTSPDGLCEYYIRVFLCGTALPAKERTQRQDGPPGVLDAEELQRRLDSCRVVVLHAMTELATTSVDDDLDDAFRLASCIIHRLTLPVLMKYAIRGRDPLLRARMPFCLVRLAKHPDVGHDIVVDALLAAIYRSGGARWRDFATFLDLLSVNGRSIRRALTSHDTARRLGACIVAGLHSYDGKDRLTDEVLQSATPSMRGCVAIGLADTRGGLESAVRGLQSQEDPNLRAWANRVLGEGRGQERQQ
jgi:hypothetical protein